MISNHKRQLHDRIRARRARLEAEQNRPQRRSSEHARAIDIALAQLEMHLAGNWDDVDDNQAAQLSAWLESTRFLVDTAAVEEFLPSMPPTVQE